MKLFLQVTAFLEGITGISLIFIPKIIISLLFLTPLENGGSVLISMIAGAALFAIALLCWFINKSEYTSPLLKTLLFYNSAIIGIIIYGALLYKINGIGIWLVIFAHSLLAIWSVLLINKNKTEEKR